MLVKSWVGIYVTGMAVMAWLGAGLSRLLCLGTSIVMPVGYAGGQVGSLVRISVGTEY